MMAAHSFEPVELEGPRVELLPGEPRTPRLWVASGCTCGWTDSPENDYAYDYTDPVERVRPDAVDRHLWLRWEQGHAPQLLGVTEGQ